jgi:hypothetical protein
VFASVTITSTRHLRIRLRSGRTLATPRDIAAEVARRSESSARQNTNTGRLTEAMLDGVFWRARELLVDV